MSSGNGDGQADALSRLAELLIKAKGLADTQPDDKLQTLVREALFRVGHLLAERTQATGPGSRSH